MAAREILLRPLVAGDIDECVRVAGLAFRGDRNTELKARSIIDPYDHEEGTRGGLNHWLRREPGAIEMTVAVDSGSGEILGWVVWGFRGFEAAPEERKQQPGSEAPPRPEPSKSLSTQTKDAKDDTHPQSMRKWLESYTSEDLQTWMQRLMPPGTKCMFICSIVVHPAHHGKGVGSALLRKGADRADIEGVFCWVHSSEAGAAFFPRFGFQEVGKLEVDLDAFNSDNITAPEGEGARWGSYTFRYMRREPQGASR